ncbi:hypothetical protein HD553DRAFT_296066 [Filobasidium floriforme]|uniref:uncharacterized protein n=1 Tax=Filobasidium floriforme TaxID=5210 RepID=UPI001E8CC539|nr:uncharacterized protein HD553DRAFT_296066 [Filobasidium floriforme]KAH8084629.1 hypothetical protein HD553DRAFT_296066 [Filobasidium floriforme]
MEALDTLSMAPPGSMSLATQVGGHGGVMSDASGSIVMKPATTREIAFYQLLSSAPNPARPTASSTINPSDVQQGPTTKYDRLLQRQLLGELKRFLPRFYGTLRLEGQVGKEGGVTPVGETPESIVLQNLSAPYVRPCILDIKLGTVLYDRDASEEKKARMEKRAKEGTSFETGVRMTGFQNWDPVSKEMIVTDKAYGYALTVDRLPEGFAKFFPLPGQNQTDDRAEPARAVQSEEAEPVVQEGQVPVEAGSSSADSTNITHATTSSSSTEAYKHSLVRVLRALHRSISDLYALLDRLEIRFIGASLLIVYEGDPEALETAWKIVDEEEKKDGSTGFGLLDKVPPRRRRANDGAPDHDHERDDTDDDEDNDADEEEDETRPRPFTARIIDFAHTRLVHGEGKDVGFLKGLETVLRLIEGRLNELESSR